MSVREYVGARYVPLFADPLTWDATRTYEPLTVVLYQGNSYTSRQAVPANIPITNTTYWAQTGNYNAQVEQYRSEVETFDDRITANATAIATEESARQSADTSLATSITAEESARQSADTSLATSITAEESARQAADTAMNTRILALEDYAKTEILAFGDSFGNEQGEWADLLGRKTGLNMHTYCIPGAAWPLPSQVANALNDFDTAAKRAKIKYAVAYAGINNCAVNPMTDGSTVQTFITEFNNSFPHIPLYIAPMNSCNPLNTNYPNAFANSYKSYANVLKTIQSGSGDFIILKDSLFFNVGAPDLWAGDLLHPSEKGYNTIANNIHAAINGTFIPEIALDMIDTPANGVSVYDTGYATAYGIYTPNIAINLSSITTTQELRFRNLGIYMQPRIHYLIGTAGVYNPNANYSVTKVENVGYVFGDTGMNLFTIRLLPQNAKAAVSGATRLMIPSQFISYGSKGMG